MDASYSKCIKINDSYIAVYSEETDKNHPNSWKAYIPHEDFRNLLEKFIRALNRGKDDDKKPLWIYGNYGTGKTYTAFVLKHLLEDPTEEVVAFFDSHKIISDLKDRFLSLRQGKGYLVLYRSGSSLLESPLRLYYTLYYHIKQNVENKVFFEEDIVHYLEEQKDILKLLFEKFYRLNYIDEEDFLNRLRKVSSEKEEEWRESINLLEDVSKKLEELQIFPLTSPESFKKWLERIIRENNLKGIIYFWDEFTDFFRVTGTITDFQELAHACKNIPFYFIPITQDDPEQYLKRWQESKNAERVHDRFHMVRLALNEVTAFKLISNTIRRKKECQPKIEALYSKVEVSAKTVIQESGGKTKYENEEIFKQLLPLHPLTAYLLTYIAENYTSAKRTLFTFLTDQTYGLKAFVERNDLDKGTLLEPDVLWDYFFEENTSGGFRNRVYDLIATGKHLLSRQLPTNVKKFLKVVLLLDILSRQEEGFHLKPTKTFLSKLLFGVSYQNDLPYIFEEVKRFGILQTIPVVGSTSDEKFVVMGYQSAEEIEEIKKDVRDSFSFSKLVSGNISLAIRVLENFSKKLFEKFAVRDPYNQRKEIYLLSVSDIPYKDSKFKIPPNGIGVGIFVMESDDDYPKAFRYCKEMSERVDRLIMILLEPPFGKHTIEKLIELIAKWKYENEVGRIEGKKVYEQQIEEIIEDFVKRIATGRQTVFWKGGERKLSMGEFGSFFIEKVKEVFKNGPECVSDLSTLYGRDRKRPLELGLFMKEVGKPFANIRDKLGDGSNKTVKSIIEKVIETFNENDSINLLELWKEFQKPPFGLSDNGISYALFARGIRELCDKGYYYTDGSTYNPLNKDAALRILQELFQGRGKGYEIKKNPQEVQFVVEKLCQAFHISKASYLEDIIRSLRSRLKEFGYPIWGIVYVVENHLNDKESVENLRIFFTLLRYILEKGIEGLNLSAIKTADYKSVAQKIFQGEETNPSEVVKSLHCLLSEKSTIVDTINKFFNKSILERGFEIFLEKELPQVYSELKEREIEIGEFATYVGRLLPEERYIWRERSVKEHAKEALNEIIIADFLAGIAGSERVDFPALVSKALTILREKTKLNLLFLAQITGEKALEKLFYLLKGESSLSPEDKEFLASEIDSSRTKLKDILENPVKYLKEYIYKEFNTEIPPHLISSKLKELEKFFSESSIFILEEEIEKFIKEHNVSNLKLKLQEEWKRITGTLTPKEWSERNRIPISWILPEKWHLIVDAFEEGSSIEMEKLKELLSWLELEEKSLIYLKDKEEVNRKFLHILFSRELVPIVEPHVRKLKDYLQGRLNKSPHYWQLQEIKPLAEDFLRKEYEKIKDMVKKSLHKLDRDSLLSIVLRLAEEAETGLKVIKILEEEGVSAK